MRIPRDVTSTAVDGLNHVLSAIVGEIVAPLGVLRTIGHRLERPTPKEHP
jgi:hypothetical protein